VRIIAVFGDEGIQRALAHKIHDAVPLCHVARIRLQSPRRRRWARGALSAATGFRRAWAALERHYDRASPDWPPVTQSVHESSNDAELAALIGETKPDLILVSGTDLLKRATIERFGVPIMNLHTGISPYVRGGPNCTNWALALGEFDLIGNTIMWLDAGIDTGAIIATERTPLTGRERLVELHIKVIDHGQELYRRAVIACSAGERLAAVPQREIATGRLLLSKHWTAIAIARAAFNFTFRYSPASLARPRPIKLISPLIG
jgi:folate-dependent phosphoribosylglycinamide formyltransferase PurN